MRQIFETILQNSLIGIFFLGVILVFRFFTRKYSKCYIYILWIFLLAELLMPPIAGVPLYSVRSIAGFTGTESTNAKTKDMAQDVLKAVPMENSGQRFEHDFADSKEADVYEIQKNREEVPEWGVLSIWENHMLPVLIWLTGALTVALFYLEQFLKLKRCVRTAVRRPDGTWESEEIEIPFVMPGIPAKIYLPEYLTGQQREDILAHERQHIRHFDPWIKCILAAALILHWFNPFVWIACRMMAEDMEMFCDEGALKGKSLEAKKQYAKTLLNFAAKTSGFSLTLSFGESNTKRRIVHIFRIRKIRFGLGIAFAVMIFFCGVFFLTSGSIEGKTAFAESHFASTKLPITTRNETDVSNRGKELTLEMIIKAYQEDRLEELDYLSYQNAEKEGSGENDLYDTVRFFFSFNGAYGKEEYRLDASFEAEQNTLMDLYLFKLSTGERKWLYTETREKPAPVDLDEFLNHKTSLDDWLTIELPEGCTLSDYRADVGLYEGGGAVIWPQVYKSYDTYFPVEWTTAGFMVKIENAAGFIFEKGRLVEKEANNAIHYWEEKLEIIDGLETPGILYHGGYGLYTLPELDELQEKGITVPEEERNTDYWHIYFAKEGKPCAYCLGLAMNTFIKEEALAVAQTIYFKDGAFE